ncbi:hypothetical protein I7412_34995, partial [Frankia sp. CN6]|nr:hypothetical protein [Frankia nepalensis]
MGTGRQAVSVVVARADVRSALIYARRSVLDDGKSVSDQESEGREDCADLG